MIDLSARHPSTQQIARWLTPNPSLTGEAAHVAGICHDAAVTLISSLPDGPELTVGLRKLLEAKDCFVRATL